MKTFTRLLTFLLVIAVFPGGSNAANNTDDLIEWSLRSELGWDDFQGMADKNAFGDAATAIHVKAQPYMIRKELVYEVHTYFVKTKSWYRKKSDALLAHEQLHFDIAELYARKARQKIEALRAENENDYKVYNKAVQAILNESNHVDEKYDRETIHGALSEKQAAWKKSIHEELIELDGFRK